MLAISHLTKKYGGKAAVNDLTLTLEAGRLVALLGPNGSGKTTLMIVFASPTAVSSFTMAEQMGGDPDLAAQQVVLTTVLSSVTIFAMIFLFKTWGIL